MKLMPVRAILVYLAAALVLPACSSGDKVPRNPEPTPAATVKAFCDLDAEGARLTSLTWGKVLPYIAWQDEAGSDRITVISGYRIGEVQQVNTETVAVTVTYDVLGILSQEYRKAPKAETIRFTVIRTSAGWKITEPDFMPPHVLEKAVARHLEETKKLEGR